MKYLLLGLALCISFVNINVLAGETKIENKEIVEPNQDAAVNKEQEEIKSEPVTAEKELIENTEIVEQEKSEPDQEIDPSVETVTISKEEYIKYKEDIENHT
ncbi:hypothetical protein ACFL4O_03690, partial [bacterium]